MTETESKALVDDLRHFFGREEPQFPKTPQGWIRWAQKPTTESPVGCLVITGTPYLVQIERDGREVFFIRLVRYDTKKGEAKVYDIDTAGSVWVCDCPHYVFRCEGTPTPCKHILGAKKALEHL